MEHGGAPFAFGKGNVFLLQAAIGKRVLRPSDVVNLLDIAQYRIEALTIQRTSYGEKANCV